MSSDLLSAALLQQFQQVRPMQDPRRALAARLMTTQPPAAPIASSGAGLAYALTQGINGLVGGYMSEQIRQDDRAERQQAFNDLTAFEDRRRQADATELAAARGMPTVQPASFRTPQIVPPNDAAPADGGGGFSPVGLATNTRLESSGNPTARPLDPNTGRPRSSAFGPNQFLDDTWLEFAAANPERFAGMSREQILAARSNGDLSAEATQWYARRNAPALQAAGLPVNDATLGMAHQFGPAGARALLQADPSTPVLNVLGVRAVAANPEQLGGRTAGEIRTSFEQRYGGGAPVVPASSGAPAGQPPAQPGARRVTPEEVDRVATLAGQGNRAAQAQLPVLRAELERQDRLAATEQARRDQMEFQRQEREAREAFQRQQREQAEADRAERARTAAATRPIPAHIQRAEDQDIEAIGAASGINQSLSTYARMLENERLGQGDPSERLSLGAVGNAVSAGRNFLGVSSPNSVNYATFRSDLERLRNESLRLNTGVQTDGDAQRAWNELITNINDPQVVARQLQRIQAINERAVQLREAMIQSRRSGSNLPPLDTSPFRRPVDATPSGPRNDVPQPGAIVDGWRFRGGNPADRNNWERAQ